MFGYATDETEECMPLTVVLAHKLNAKIAELRRNGQMAWARPDSKTQVGHACLIQRKGLNSLRKWFKLAIHVLESLKPYTKYVFMPLK